MGVAGDVVSPSLTTALGFLASFVSAVGVGLAGFFFFLDFLGPMVGVAGDVVSPSLTKVLGFLASFVSAVGVGLAGVFVIEIAFIEVTTLAKVTAARFASRAPRNLCLVFANLNLKVRKFKKCKF